MSSPEIEFSSSEEDYDESSAGSTEPTSNCNRAASPVDDESLMAAWDNASSYSQLLHLNRHFLEGTMGFTPYYAGPIDKETRSMVPSLLRLHDYGFFTVSSQPSSKVELEKRPCLCCEEMTYHSGKQRAFLSFLLPQFLSKIDPLALKRFLADLITDDHFYASILSFDNLCRSGGCVSKPKFESSFPDKWETHLDRFAESEEELAEATERSRKFIQLECTCIVKTLETPFRLMDEIKPFVIHVLAKSWEEQDLPLRVTLAAIKAGMKPVYSEEY